MTLTSGIHYDVPSNIYFDDPAPKPSLTQSIAKVLIEQSPLHAKIAHPRLTMQGEPDTEYTKARAIGNAAHKAMLGRGKDIVVPPFDDWRTKEARQAKADAIKAGKEIILAHHYVDAEALVSAARSQLREMGVHAFSDNRSEVVAIVEEDGIWLRTMIDWPSIDCAVCYDYKTTGMSVAPHAIPAMMVQAGWDVQAAMQERILDALDPEYSGRRKFRFVAQENYEPYALTVCELPESTMTMGRKKIAHAVDLWRRSMETGLWPGYPDEILYPAYPGFKEAQWLEREIVFHDARQTRRTPMLTNLMGG